MYMKPDTINRFFRHIIAPLLDPKSVDVKYLVILGHHTTENMKNEIIQNLKRKYESLIFLSVPVV
jgi:uncharacterized phage-like protein YoqJ